MRKLFVVLFVAVLCVLALADVNITAFGNNADLEIYMDTTSGDVCLSVDAHLGSVVGDDVTTVNQTECVTGPLEALCWRNHVCITNGDANGDCIITFVDLDILMSAWPPNPYEPCADFNKDRAITFGDLSVIIEHWPPNPGCDLYCVPVR